MAGKITMGYIFISYSHEDKEYVQKLQDDLQKRGFEVWIDEHLEYGVEWPIVIQEKLDDSDAFIVVMTEKAKKSNWVQNEVTRARRIGKPVFPLLLSGDSWLAFEATQYVDVKEGRLPSREFYDQLSIFIRPDDESYKLFSEATHLNLIGDINGALKFYRQIKEIHPYYPRVDTIIHALEKEIGKTKTEETSHTHRRLSLTLIVGIIGVLALSVLALTSPLLIGRIWKPTPASTSTVLNIIPIPARTESPTETEKPVVTASATAFPSEIRDQADIPMVLIPRGEFTMGRLDAEANERPAHQVFLDDYYIDKFEVTNGAYAACEADGVCKPPSNFSSQARSEYYNDVGYRNFPVIHVDWEMANAYCTWRRARLPTEAEWEKAARGEDPNNKFYPWGRDTGCKFGNFAACNKDTTEVGNYPEGKSPYGVYDMAGNVWEWVADWYGYTYYELSPYNNPQGPDEGEYRVLRGGSWNNPPNEVRVSYRVRYYPYIERFNLGFRCARSANP